MKKLRAKIAKLKVNNVKHLEVLIWNEAIDKVLFILDNTPISEYK